MEKFTTHTGVAAPLRHSNVDTDQIIPAEYLKRITRTGYEDALFSAWRDESADPPALVVQVGTTQLSYHLSCLDDLQAMLAEHAQQRASLAAAADLAPSDDAERQTVWNRAARCSGAGN